MSQYQLEREDAPERSFVLGGKTWQCRRGKVPMQLLFTVAELMAETEGEDQGERSFKLVRGLREFLAQMVTQSDREAFRRFLVEVPEEDDSPEAYDIEDLKTVVRDLVAEVSNAPFRPPSASPPSRAPNGGSVTVTSGSEASGSETNPPTRP